MYSRYSVITLCTLLCASAYAELPKTKEEYLAPLRQIISCDAINQKIEEVSRQINHEYAGKSIALVMVMTGAVTVTTDLMKKLEIPCTLHAVKASSYGHGMTSGELTVSGLDKLDLAGKNVLLVDDIFDTGKTLNTIRSQIMQKDPASIKTLVLLSKNVERTTDYRPDYVLFDIENHFVVGYGLDYKDHYRGLPGVYVLNHIPEWLQ